MTIEHINCRSCSHPDLVEVLDLGLQPLANNLLRQEDLAKPEPRFPLCLFVCSNCWLLQIGDLIPPVDLFSDYLYFSSFSDAMLRHAREAAETHIARLELNQRSFVVEVASNDGYLLKNFVEKGIPCLGVEPAANIAEIAIRNGIPTRIEFFGETTAISLRDEFQPADLILGNNVFAHAPDTNDFVAGLARLLAPGGTIALEFPCALDFLENLEFDTIYHEHVFYFALTPLLPLFERHGLTIYDLEKLPIHGGSLRIHAGHRGAHGVKDSVRIMSVLEEQAGLENLSAYDQFRERVNGLRQQLRETLMDLKAQGHSIAAYGASAKGSTLLNSLDLPPGTLDFVADRSTYKQGRFSPGLHLPILPPEALAERQPDYALLLTWNFADEILAQQNAYREAGGKFIIPLPEINIV